MPIERRNYAWEYSEATLFVGLMCFTCVLLRDWYCHIVDRRYVEEAQSMLFQGVLLLGNKSWKVEVEGRLDSHKDEDDCCPPRHVLHCRLRHLFLPKHIVCCCRDGQGNAGQEQQAAASLVDHGAEALLLEPRSTKEEAHACDQRSQCLYDGMLARLAR